MDNLEKYIKENREAFENKIPNDLMWKEISNHIHSKNNSNMRMLFRVAAAIILFISAYFIQTQFISDNENIVEIKETSIPPQFASLTKNYNEQASQLLKEVELITKSEPALQQEVLSDYFEIDSLIRLTQNDLNDQIDNRAVLISLLNYYELKINILQDIIDQLNTSQNHNQTNINLNTEKDEKNKIISL